MSSTEEKRLRKFFEKRLVKAAQALRERGVRFFRLGPEPEAETWYVDFPPDQPEFVEFSDADCEDALRAMWERENLPELAALAGPLVKLSKQLEVRKADAGDVSPFIYVMY